ncbi:MAG: hypothetical protein JSU63_18205 [Phycisphaerales bacterium]|nr:MAG: hypothetical protein JSU63_18205 [Phycisphaerales bacterium]
MNVDARSTCQHQRLAVLQVEQERNSVHWMWSRRGHLRACPDAKNPMHLSAASPTLFGALQQTVAGDPAAVNLSGNWVDAGAMSGGSRRRYLCR